MTQIKKRQVAFMAIAIIIPFVVLISLEFLLGVFHYGYDTRLFIEDSTKPGIINTNTHISKLFFSNNKDARLGIQHSFKKVKSPETFRIFVLGESSAFGYPYTQRASFARMLEYRLANTFKNRNIEMINLSITAINSIAFLNFTNEIIEMEPDAILIYAGHNEYYGAMGVGSSHRIGSNRNIINSIISLRKFKVVQLAFDFSGFIRSLFAKNGQKEGKGFMHRMSGEQEVPYGSPLFRKGIDQFEGNMDGLLSLFDKHQIPVFYSNLVSNERGQKPFISILNVADTTSFFKEFRKGFQAFNSGAYDEAETSFLNAGQIDSTYAMNNFLLGEIAYLKGNFEQACRYFKQAKDFDALRFRAPEAINRKIKELSLKYGHIHFVDAKKEFTEQSPSGILDNHLFTDHLHPNLFGYFLLSEAFYKSIIESGIAGKNTNSVSATDSWNEMPVTTVDSIYGDWMAMVMKEQWPFYEKADFDPDKNLSYPEKLTLQIFNNQISMDMAMDSLFAFYSKEGDILQSLKVIKSMGLDHPENWRYPAETANLYSMLPDFEESLYYYKKSFEKFPNPEIARKIVFNLLQLDSPAGTKYYLEYLLQHQPSDRMAAQLLEKTQAIMGFKKQLLSDPENVSAILGIADYYLFIRNMGEAKKYIDKAVEKYPDDKGVQRVRNEYNKLSSANIGRSGLKK